LGSKQNHKVNCFLCKREGYLIKDGPYWKIAHNLRTKKGKWTVKKCHLGNLQTVLQKIEKISNSRLDKIDSNLVKMIKDNIPKNVKVEKIDTHLSKLITNVFNLAKNLGEGWIETRKSRIGYVWNKAKCPHCEQDVQFLFWKEGNHRLVRLDIPKS